MCGCSIKTLHDIVFFVCFSSDTCLYIYHSKILNVLRAYGISVHVCSRLVLAVTNEE